VVIGVEAGRAVVECQAILDRVSRGSGGKLSRIRAVATALEAVAVADPRHRIGAGAVVPSPGALHGAGVEGVDEVVAVVRVPPRTAAAKHVACVTRPNVAAKAIRALSGAVG